MHAKKYSTVALDFEYRATNEVQSRSATFKTLMQQRRTVRDFANTPVPQDIIENAIAVASSAPSGANMQPWHFAAISNPGIKKQIRDAAEAEEKKLYEHRASDEWLEALSPLGIYENKPFLETAPWLIAVFAQKFSFNDAGEKQKIYYTPESVGIATGMLITALHHAGLATLTHTPSPMGFLRDILKRPAHEKPFVLLVTGYPQENTQVPEIDKKSPDEYLSMFV